MDRNGITERAQVGKLSRVLKLSPAQAHRKMNGKSPWTLPQVDRVATYFGETMSSLLDTTNRGMPHKAVLMVGGSRLSCRVRVGAEYNGTGEYPGFLSVRQDDQWQIYGPEHACSADSIRYVVESIEFDTQASATKSSMIAVVDDDKDSADSVSDFLNIGGFRADPYYSTITAREALSKRKYDGFVLDWILDSETAESLIREIRESTRPSTPVFLLTGQFNSGRAKENDIARVINSYNVEWIEKPVRMPLLIAEITRKLTHL